MTIQNVLQSADLEQLDAELILAHVLKKDRTYLKAHPEALISFFKRIQFWWLVAKRKKNIPLAYIIGTKDFFGLPFKVNKHTLVPRPETEQLVSLAISHITQQILKNKKVLLIDIGTGSGCIPIAIGKHIPPQSAQLLASDISKKALQVAKQNAKTHQIDLTLFHGNLLDPLIKKWANETMEQWNNIVITANLPYLTEEQFQEEPSIQKEPKSALVAKENGLALYRELLEELKKIHVTHPTVPITLYLEIDPAQEDTIQSLIYTYFPESHVILHQDLAGYARIVTLETI